jgi:hypothetical protein
MQKSDIPCPSCGTGRVGVPRQNEAEKAQRVKAMMVGCSNYDCWWQLVYDENGEWIEQPPRLDPLHSP